MDWTTGVTATTLTLAARYALHFADEIMQAWDLIGSNRRAGVEKGLKVILGGAIPVGGCVSWEFSAIPDGGALGSIATGLALAAVIAGLHNAGKAGRKRATKEAEVADAQAKVAKAQAVVEVTRAAAIQAARPEFQRVTARPVAPWAVPPEDEGDPYADAPDEIPLHGEES